MEKLSGYKDKIERIDIRKSENGIMPASTIANRRILRQSGTQMLAHACMNFNFACILKHCINF